MKFRVWDKTKKCWLDYDEIFIDQEGEVFLIEERNWAYQSLMHKENITDKVEVVQYTGLKDKNDKEIYEGDVLLFNNDYPNAQKMDWKCVVKYRKGSFVCEYPKDGVYNHFDSWNVPKVTWEVIGNIYENPSLLEV
ncbi:YopX family protein [Heyndrickxia sp. FSL W8-0423]|uniref:YopX family protein n=1 Tax=Heyndrickxia sp. FSL W8-0423 TaxID=2921601 RepID=UPI0030FA15C3